MDTALNTAVARANDTEDLLADGVAINWMGPNRATRWAASADSAVACSTGLADLADFGFTADWL